MADKSALRSFSDKISGYTDKIGIANPLEVADEALGGQTREESKMRREKEVKETPQPVKKMAKGGTASSRADGCATKGKTKGRFV